MPAALPPFYEDLPLPAPYFRPLFLIFQIPPSGEGNQNLLLLKGEGGPNYVYLTVLTCNLVSNLYYRLRRVYVLSFILFVYTYTLGFYSFTCIYIYIHIYIIYKYIYISLIYVYILLIYIYILLTHIYY